MKITLDAAGDKALQAEVKILTALAVSAKGKSQESVSIAHWQDKTLAEEFKGLKSFAHFKAQKDETITFTGPLGETVKVVGLGEKSKYKAEDLRKSIARVFKACKSEKHASLSIDVSGFNTTGDIAATAGLIAESVQLSNYAFDKYLTKKAPTDLKEVFLANFDRKSLAKAEKNVEAATHITASINVARDLVNEAPNVLHSVEYAKRIEADVKNLKRVKLKILNKAEIKKEKMELFLSVNAGSAHEPRLVHLTYEPAKKTAKTRHIALVGKGITFDTGGYCIKPGASMAGMKHDMGGSATVYGAFRAAVLQNAPVKITCILAITDNAINEHATTPDAIVRGRNGKTVEILNTDAEGRLILADALDYACDQKPDAIIDAATLTGAVLVALGNQMAAILGNNQPWINKVLKAAQEQDEYMWQLPIINEWKSDMKSKIADLRNIGTPMRAGTALGAAFLEEFIKNDIPWAHLDIAGVADGQSHLPYCPPQGASGLIIRTLSHLLVNGG